ncbi:MAG: ATP-binding cassette domain-containing protein [Thermodesulfovibrionales bacterium]
MSLSLSVRNIAKSYGGREILRGCSFAFPERGVTVLMGPNGSGKSTFLRICAMLEPADAGEVAYADNGTPLAAGLGLRRRVTLVLPDTGVFNATVLKNVSYGLAIRGVPARQARGKAEHCLELLGLIGRKDQNARTLSSGETRRLGIARALAIDPEILFLDEPTSSVDQENTDIIQKLILGMKADQRPMVVMSTHDEAEARLLADLVLDITKGRISPRTS